MVSHFNRFRPSFAARPFTLLWWHIPWSVLASPLRPTLKYLAIVKNRKTSSRLYSIIDCHNDVFVVYMRLEKLMSWEKIHENHEGCYFAKTFGTEIVMRSPSQSCFLLRSKKANVVSGESPTWPKFCENELFTSATRFQAPLAGVLQQCAGQHKIQTMMYESQKLWKHFALCLPDLAGICKNTVDCRLRCSFCTWALLPSSFSAGQS